MGVTSEEDLGDGMKNDDKILHCCLALDAGPPAHTEGGMKTVSRTSVLLTDDRYRTYLEVRWPQWWRTRLIQHFPGSNPAGP
jgi:hypothetical protein